MTALFLSLCLSVSIAAPKIDRRVTPIGEIAAPPSWWSMTESERESYSSGCGPDESFIDVSKWPVDDLTIPCQIHDYMYSIGGTEEDRLFADSIMLQNFESVAAKKQTGRLGQVIVRHYYRVTRSLGWLFFRFR